MPMNMMEKAAAMGKYLVVEERFCESESSYCEGVVLWVWSSSICDVDGTDIFSLPLGFVIASMHYCRQSDIGDENCTVYNNE